MDERPTTRRTARRRRTLAVGAAIGAILLTAAPTTAVEPGHRDRPEHDHPAVRPAGRRRRQDHVAAHRRRLRAPQPTGTRWSASRTASASLRDDGKIVVYMNHELRDTVGHRPTPRADGAFVSSCVIDPDTTSRSSQGSDLIDPGVPYWDYPNGDYVTTAPALRRSRRAGPGLRAVLLRHPVGPGRALQRAHRRGYRGQIWFANEENGDNGRVFGVTEDGERYGAAAPRPVLLGEHGPRGQPVATPRWSWARRTAPATEPAVGLRRQQAAGRRARVTRPASRTG